MTTTVFSSVKVSMAWRRPTPEAEPARAGEIWRKMLEEYEQPPLDAAIEEELAEYVTRRRAELGD